MPSLIHMVLADNDYEYVNHLVQWFRENKSDSFQISAFTEKESFQKFISESKNKIDIILASEDFLTENASGHGIPIVLGQAVKLNDLPSIEKYQPAPSVCSDILSVISVNKNEVKKWFGSGKSELVACFSPDIYIKSTFAMLLSAVSQDYIYINLESFPFYIMDQDFQSYSKNLSDILYHIKSRKGEPVMALESAVIEGNGQISFIPPMDNPGDLWELTDEEQDIFIEALKSWGHFSKIVIDTECNTGPMTIKLFEAASCIIVPFGKTHAGQIQRIKNMLESIRGLDTHKVKWVFCGNGEESFLPDLDNCYEFRWLSAAMPGWGDFAADPDKKRQLEALFTK